VAGGGLLGLVGLGGRGLVGHVRCSLVVRRPPRDVPVRAVRPAGSAPPPAPRRSTFPGPPARRCVDRAARGRRSRRGRWPGRTVGRSGRRCGAPREGRVPAAGRLPAAMPPSPPPTVAGRRSRRPWRGDGPPPPAPRRA